MAKEDPYPPLFEQYVKELRALFESRMQERANGVRRLMDAQGVDEATATAQIDARGPLVHDPRAIHLIRKYWLAVDRIKNEKLAQADDEDDDEGFLEPLAFLVEDLAAQPGNDDLVQFLTRIAYWPVGIDEKGEWT